MIQKNDGRNNIDFFIENKKRHGFLLERVLVKKEVQKLFFWSKVEDINFRNQQRRRYFIDNQPQKLNI